MTVHSHTPIHTCQRVAAGTTTTSGWVLPISDSPKPPPERITMTLPVINAAREIILFAMGEEKVRERGGGESV